MSEPIATCVVPMVPASVLCPNRTRTRHWSERSDAASALRSAAKYAGKEALHWEHDEPLTTAPVRLRCVIYWPKRRPGQDFQNAVTSLKALVDGLQDAAWFADDSQVIGMDVLQERDPDGQGRVHVEMHHA